MIPGYHCRRDGSPAFLGASLAYRSFVCGISRSGTDYQSLALGLMRPILKLGHNPHTKALLSPPHVSNYLQLIQWRRSSSFPVGGA
ncbi:hypothetical protein SAMN05444161_5564 [Rhizobiales bacterium GAS191]|nr:hypothetical protein SAMN05444161_5564 [Rhizobiales bacterium GAS191]